MSGGRGTESGRKIVFRLGSTGSRFLDEALVMNFGRGGNRGSLSGIGWRRKRRGCGNTSVGGGGGISRGNNGSLGWRGRGGGDRSGGGGG